MRNTLMYLKKLTVCLFTCALLAACGGSGTATASTPSAYTGQTRQAVIDDSNAEDLAYNSFTIAPVGPALVSHSLSAIENKWQAPSIFQLSQILTESIPESGRLQREEINSVAKDSKVSGYFRVRFIADSFSYGNCGGAVDQDIQVNEASGEFTGRFIYADYCSGKITFSGDVQVSGRMNTESGRFRSITLSMDGLRGTSIYNTSVVLNGTIEWADSDDQTEETTQIDMVLSNETTGKNYWVNNYRMSINQGASEHTMELSGRFYHFDYGFVDLVTTAPFVTKGLFYWPTSGELQFNGEGNRHGRVVFGTSTIHLEVDTSGDGISDWSLERSLAD